MIPSKKKSSEEIAALRDGLGIPSAEAELEEIPIDEIEEVATSPELAGSEIIPTLKPLRSLRKNELELNKASIALGKTKTVLPTHRHDRRELQQVLKREKLARMAQSVEDPVTRLRRLTASPIIYSLGYALAIASAITVWMNMEYAIPLALTALASGITAYMAIFKIRSRHHAGLLFMIIFFTVVFGIIHYAQQFQHGT